MGITEGPGWKILQMMNCDHLDVKVIECSPTTLAAALPPSGFMFLAVEESKIKLLCLGCWTRALRLRQQSLMERN